MLPVEGNNDFHNHSNENIKKNNIILRLRSEE